MLLALPCALLSAVLLSLATARSISTRSEAASYLNQYGYLPTRPSAFNPMAVSNAIRDFQATNQLMLTGEVDAQTKALMSLPRCGVKDKLPTRVNTRGRRFSHIGIKWRSKALTYRINSYPTGPLSRDTVRSEIARAFDVWAKQTVLTFTARSSGQADIIIDFASGEHGDGYAFDGPGQVLAHVTLDDGNAHFDNSEHWTISSYDGINLFQVAAHEFGHSLGLGHSYYRGALMAPYYRGYDSSFRLHADDIDGIQRLYGKPETRMSRNCAGTWALDRDGVFVCSTMN